MLKTKYTFWELMSDSGIKKGIEIPMIQRDYAQGRDKPNVNEIRNDFLNDILFKTEASLKDNSNPKLELDFVYGSIDNNKFIPLDGQQRLTTLFLIHWYLALKDKCLSEYNSVFSKFSYQTRATSRQFCAKLTSAINQETFCKELFDKEIQNETEVSELIKNQYWFYLNWKHDPTIQSMLIMLDSIHNKFKKTNLTFEDLIDSEKQLITFHYLPIETYGLSDSLYIKMNARGKILTKFENFKAKFENFIEEKHSHLKKGFTDKIDGIWCDIIWDFIRNQQESKEFNRFDLVDEPLLNLIYYISEMLFYKSKLNEEFDFDKSFKTIEIIYSSEENVDFLYNALDVFAFEGSENKKELINNFFGEVFSKNYKKNKVAIFDEKQNLFENCIFKDSFEIKEKLFLYSILFYQSKTESKTIEITENFKNYIRICRNYILSINQKRKDEFVPELRREYYYELIHSVELFYDKDDVYKSIKSKKDKFIYKTENVKHEIDKAEVINIDSTMKEFIHKLEDHKYLKGDIHNFEFNDKTNLQFISNEIHLIWSKLNDSLITRALLTNGDYSEYIGNSAFGGVWFFGKGEKWNRILTSNSTTDNRISTVLGTFFKQLQLIKALDIEMKLVSIIDNGLKNLQNNGWRYYFVKYPDITSTGNNIFTFDDNQDFMVEKLGGTSLRSYHINIFIHALVSSPYLNNKVSKNCWQKDTYFSLIFLKYNILIYPKDNYWLIDAKKRDLSSYVKEFNLEKIENKNQFKLFPTENKDFVEIGIDFINKIYE